MLTWTSLFGQFVLTVEGGWVKGVGRFFQPATSFILLRVHDNLVKDPSNNKSIYIGCHSHEGRTTKGGGGGKVTLF